ncbi:HigA family addiction module antidote protein [Euhalothece natronophila Z-M001]|uniref:HigA family addiction module antidote protein n=1 Tax=Euhalothece natronophila Z-M001 TaxID=522448 RepID=A0A5B8NPQ8_9CHRO|nr:HigA family addiction module antitoxin [Euhalothece natronophila]QDZ40189.1 HigA family addiction module antidote protein [Euhalothece natronophila Z-M001]
MKEDKLYAVHPGEVLLEEFLKPMNLNPSEVALALNIPTQQMKDIVNHKQGITADVALRLAYFFNMSPRFWLGLQMDYDLDIVEDRIGEQLKKEITVRSFHSHES